MPELFGANPFNLLPHLAALAVAYLLALPIGWNREKQERSAGLRTFPLVAVASCGFIQAAESIVGDDPEAIARIVEGIITGMGFIGGGAILRMKESVKGTATAASLLRHRPVGHHHDHALGPVAAQVRTGRGTEARGGGRWAGRPSRGWRALTVRAFSPMSG